MNTENKLVRVQIEKLFGKFDYVIDLNCEEGITILTGPNGYGKTTILNIIAGLFNGGCPDNPLFEKITCVFSDGQTLQRGAEKKDNFLFNFPVYSIKDQRLVQNAKPLAQNSLAPMINARSSEKRIERIIDVCSRELVQLIGNARQSEQSKSAALNATYASRLFDYKTPLSVSEFSSRSQDVEKLYKQLLEYGIFQTELKMAPYDETENRRALSIYLEDWEERISVYKELLSQMNTYLELLNKKRLANKKALIKAIGGLKFVSDTEKQIPLTALSSGEQNEAILLYELIFKAKPNSLVLIDEPETSLHVSWQHEFLRDLKAIKKAKPLSFLIATHSPSIINEHWDLTQDLFEKASQTAGDSNE